MWSLIKLVYGKTTILTGSAIIGHYGFSDSNFLAASCISEKRKHIHPFPWGRLRLQYARGRAAKFKMADEKLHSTDSNVACEGFLQA